jgi:hypothetical protein
MSEMRKARAPREVSGMKTVRGVGVGDAGEGNEENENIPQLHSHLLQFSRLCYISVNE